MPKPPGSPLDKVKPASRRTVLKAGATLLLSLCTTGQARAAGIVAVRVWPAADYTRVTVENDSKLKASHFIVKDPHRLVVEIEGVELDNKLKSLVAKIQPNDPYIAQVRVGQNRPGVVRMVFDLKEEIQPQVFTLEPVGEYKHRLIFDLFPLNPVDPIADFLQKNPPSADLRPPADNPSAAKPGSNDDKLTPLTRMVTIALDPGHGGEDPGAVGRGGSYEKNVVLSIARRLKSRLEQQANVRVMLTRDGDYFVPLHVRVQKAR
jgi:N-acetylmuramoyl-L-alanine amidase